MSSPAQRTGRSGVESRPETSFYVVAETVCPKCKGTCRDNRQGRHGEPDYCDECGGDGMKARRVDLRIALAELGVAVAEVIDE